MRILPTNRLLATVGAVFLPLSIWVAFRPGNTAIATLLTVAVIAVALLDAFKSAGQLHGIRATLPDIVRLSKFRDGEFEVQIENEMVQLRRIRLGLAFPAEIMSTAAERYVNLPADTTVSILRWPCKGLKQGRYVLDRCFLGTFSPLGFWAIRRSDPAQLEFRVYPNLMVERKNLSSLFLNRGLGIHAQRQVALTSTINDLR